MSTTPPNLMGNSRFECGPTWPDPLPRLGRVEPLDLVHLNDVTPFFSSSVNERGDTVLVGNGTGRTCPVSVTSTILLPSTEGYIGEDWSCFRKTTDKWPNGPDLTQFRVHRRKNNLKKINQRIIGDKEKEQWRRKSSGLKDISWYKIQVGVITDRGTLRRRRGPTRLVGGQTRPTRRQTRLTNDSRVKGWHPKTLTFIPPSYRHTPTYSSLDHTRRILFTEGTQTKTYTVGPRLLWRVNLTSKRESSKRDNRSGELDSPFLLCHTPFSFKGGTSVSLFGQA